MNHYLVDSAAYFVHTYPLDGDLSIGSQYPTLNNWALDKNKHDIILDLNNHFN